MLKPVKIQQSTDSSSSRKIEMKVGLKPMPFDGVLVVMKNILWTILAVTALVGASATTSFAAPPPTYHLTTVSWVIATRDNLDKDDHYVTLIGHVTGRAGDDLWFTDGTGSVRLDTGDFDLPIGPRIVVGGRIDQAYLGIGHLEVDVRNWHLARHP
jgi:uncharacterized protein YdeI (BOF family)